MWNNKNIIIVTSVVITSDGDFVVRIVEYIFGGRAEREGAKEALKVARFLPSDLWIDSIRWRGQLRHTGTGRPTYKNCVRPG